MAPSGISDSGRTGSAQSAAAAAPSAPPAGAPSFQNRVVNPYAAVHLRATPGAVSRSSSGAQGLPDRRTSSFDAASAKRTIDNLAAHVGPAKAALESAEHSGDKARITQAKREMAIATGTLAEVLERTIATAITRLRWACQSIPPDDAERTINECYEAYAHAMATYRSSLPKSLAIKPELRKALEDIAKGFQDTAVSLASTPVKSPAPAVAADTPPPAAATHELERITSYLTTATAGATKPGDLDDIINRARGRETPGSTPSSDTPEGRFASALSAAEGKRESLLQAARKQQAEAETETEARVTDLIRSFTAQDGDTTKSVQARIDQAKADFESLKPSLGETRKAEVTAKFEAEVQKAQDAVDFSVAVSNLAKSTRRLSLASADTPDRKRTAAELEDTIKQARSDLASLTPDLNKNADRSQPARAAFDKAIQDASGKLAALSAAETLQGQISSLNAGRTSEDVGQLQSAISQALARAGELTEALGKYPTISAPTQAALQEAIRNTQRRIDELGREQEMTGFDRDARDHQVAQSQLQEAALAQERDTDAGPQTPPETPATGAAAAGPLATVAIAGNVVAAETPAIPPHAAPEPAALKFREKIKQFARYAGDFIESQDRKAIVLAPDGRAFRENAFGRPAPMLPARILPGDSLRLSADHAAEVAHRGVINRPPNEGVMYKGVAEQSTVPPAPASQPASAEGRAQTAAPSGIVDDNGVGAFTPAERRAARAAAPATGRTTPTTGANLQALDQQADEARRIQNRVSNAVSLEALKAAAQAAAGNVAPESLEPDSPVPASPAATSTKDVTPLGIFMEARNGDPFRATINTILAKAKDLFAQARKKASATAASAQPVAVGDTLDFAQELSKETKKIATKQTKGIAGFFLKRESFFFAKLFSLFNRTARTAISAVEAATTAVKAAEAAQKAGRADVVADAAHVVYQALAKLSEHNEANVLVTKLYREAPGQAQP